MKNLEKFQENKVKINSVLGGLDAKSTRTEKKVTAPESCPDTRVYTYGDNDGGEERYIGKSLILCKVD